MVGLPWMKPLSLTQATQKALLEREHLSDYLKYLVYDDESELYLDTDNSLAFAVEVMPRVYASEATANTFENMLGSLPSYASMQTVLFGSPNILPITDAWRRLDVHQSALLTTWKERYSEFLFDKTTKNITSVMKSRVRDIRVFISIKIPDLTKQQKGVGFGGMFKKIGKMASASLKSINPEQFETTIEARNRLIGMLQTGNFDYWTMTPDILIGALYQVFNPNHDLRRIPRYQSDIEIRKQIVMDSSLARIHNNSVEFDGVHYQSLSVKEYPPDFHLAYMGNLIGDYFFNESQFSSPYIISHNVIKKPPEYHQELKRNGSMILMQKMPEQIFPRLAMKQADLKDGIEKVEINEPLLSACLNVFVSGKDEKDLYANAERAKGFWKTKRFTLLNDKYITMPAMLACMPMQYDYDTDQNLGRSRVWFADTAAAFYPIEADWKGSQNPAIPLISRRGQLMAFDIFDSNTNFGSYVIATSGAGKSVFVNFLTSNYLTQGCRVFVLDIGRSYEKQVKINGGQWIEFDPSNPMSINPFSTLTTKEDLDEFLDFLINLVFFMGAPISLRDSESIEKLMKAKLEQAIVACYKNKGPDMLIDDIIDAMRELSAAESGQPDQRLLDFAAQLEPYSTRGRFGKFFSGKSQIDFTAQLVVIENEQLENIPELRDPVMMMVCFHISRNIYQQHKMLKAGGPKYAHDLVFIDEAHKFLGNPKIDLFIEQAYRRFRKHGAGISIITQGFNDLYVPNDQGVNTSRAGRVIIENSAFKFFLLQTKESIQTLKTSRQIPLQDFEIDLMESIRPVKGQYSEVFICTPWGINTLARLVLDRYSYHMYSTDKADKNRMEGKLNSGMSLPDAIDELVREDLAREEDNSGRK